jgi:N-acetylglucosamine-6-sulfatase
VRTERYTYAEYETAERELYGLATDPYQLEKLIDGADPALVADLGAKLDALKGCAGDSCREAEDAP